MRIALLLSLALLAACSTSQHSAINLQTTQTLDHKLLAKARISPQAAKTPDCKDYDAKAAEGIEDGYRKVRKRWQLINKCLYSDQGPRKLVVLLDGTENTKKDNTNIWRMYNQALEQANSGARVIPYYDKGVATSITTPFGALFGSGVSLNIRQAYRFLIEAYRPGDEIYIFGFSRGAFTARSLNGFIEVAGLPSNLKADYWDNSLLWGWTGHMHDVVEDMYDIYKSRNDGVPGFDDTLRKRLKNYQDANGIRVYGDDPAKKDEKRSWSKSSGYSTPCRQWAPTSRKSPTNTAWSCMPSAVITPCPWMNNERRSACCVSACSNRSHRYWKRCGLPARMPMWGRLPE